MSRPRALVLAALLALAGCSGLSGVPADGADPAPTATPAPVPDAGERSHPVPGLGAESVVAPGRLADAHVASLRNRSLTVRDRKVVRYTDGSVRSNVTVVQRLGPDRRRGHLVIDRRASPFFPDGRFERYRVGSGGLVARFDRDRARYFYTEANETARDLPLLDPTRRAKIAILLRATGPVTVERVGTTDGIAVYRVRADRLDAAGVARVTPVTSVESAALTVRVTAHGRVVEYRLSYTGRVQRRTVRGIDHVRFVRVGTTPVAPPDWYATALDSTEANASAVGVGIATSTPATPGSAGT